jgi:GDPmannose 4,6-dehydratase
VRDFASLAFAAAEVPLAWEGEGLEERGIDVKSGKTLVRINPRYYRPAEVDLLIGDASKAREHLGWTAKTSLESLCQMMIEADLRRNSHGSSF